MLGRTTPGRTPSSYLLPIPRPTRPAACPRGAVAAPARPGDPPAPTVPRGRGPRSCPSAAPDPQRPAAAHSTSSDGWRWGIHGEKGRGREMRARGEGRGVAGGEELGEGRGVRNVRPRPRTSRYSWSPRQPGGPCKPPFLVFPKAPQPGSSPHSPVILTEAHTKILPYTNSSLLRTCRGKGRPTPLPVQFAPPTPCLFKRTE